MVLRADLMLVAIWSRTSLRAILKDLPPTLRCVGNVYSEVGCNWKRFYSAALTKRYPDILVGGRASLQRLCISDSNFRKCSLLSGRTAARRAHLRSHSGWNAGAALAYAPTAPEFTIQPHLFRVLLLERL